MAFMINLHFTFIPHIGNQLLSEYHGRKRYFQNDLCLLRDVIFY